MKNKDRFKVPEHERAEFNRLVRRANNAIMRNLKYIQQEEITTDSGRRALLGRQVDPAEWHTEKTPFSRSINFKGRITENGYKISAEQEYKAYKRMLERFGGDNAEHNVDNVKEGYYKAIVKSLTTMAMETGAPVMTKKGYLPKKITDAIKDLTLEQMTHYFDEGDEAEELEYLYYKWDDFVGVESREDFVEIALARINKIKDVYPSKSQRELRNFYKGTKHEGKTITELEKVFKRRQSKAKYRAKKKRK